MVQDRAAPAHRRRARARAQRGGAGHAALRGRPRARPALAGRRGRSRGRAHRMDRQRGGRSPMSTAFPPIADYAFLSDCETCALIAPSGNVEWMCLPRLAPPSVFGAILDRDAGSFRLGPADAGVPAARRYIPGTLVLETSWETKTGWMIVRDALCIGPWHHDQQRSSTHRRSPTDYDAEHVLVRTIKCVHGSVMLALDCEPAFDYGGLAAEWTSAGSGYGEAVAKSIGMKLQPQLVTGLRLGLEGPRARARTTLEEGEAVFVALGWADNALPRSYEEADEKIS